MPRVFPRPWKAGAHGRKTCAGVAGTVGQWVWLGLSQKKSRFEASGQYQQWWQLSGPNRDMVERRPA